MLREWYAVEVCLVFEIVNKIAVNEKHRLLAELFRHFFNVIHDHLNVPFWMLLYVLCTELLFAVTFVNDKSVEVKERICDIIIKNSRT